MRFEVARFCNRDHVIKAEADGARGLEHIGGAKKAIPHWTLHDLRRTIVTHVTELGFTQPYVIEAIVNHVASRWTMTLNHRGRAVCSARHTRRLFFVPKGTRGAAPTADIELPRRLANRSPRTVTHFGQQC